MNRTPATRPSRILRAFMFCAEHLDPGDPEFVRVSGLNAALILLGAAGLAFALFNSLVVGTASVLPLILFDLAAFAAAAVIGLYLWRTHEIERSARATDFACFVAFLVLVISQEGGEYFAVWAMVYPPLALMLVGMRRGLVHVAVFFLVLLVLAVSNLGVWNHGNLNAVAISNLAGAALALTGIVAIYHGAQRNAQTRVGVIRRDLENLSIRDGLTGLYNRRWFSVMLKQELARASREQRDLVLLVLDVDHFKAYNDRFGHPGPGPDCYRGSAERRVPSRHGFRVPDRRRGVHGHLPCADDRRGPGAGRSGTGRGREPGHRCTGLSGRPADCLGRCRLILQRPRSRSRDRLHRGRSRALPREARGPESGRQYRGG